MNDKKNADLPENHDLPAPAADATPEPADAETRELPLATSATLEPRRPWWRKPVALAAAIAVAALVLIAGTAAITTQVTLASTNQQHSRIGGPGGAEGMGPGQGNRPGGSEGSGKDDANRGPGNGPGQGSGPADGRGPGNYSGNRKGPADGKGPGTQNGTAPTAPPTAPAAP